MRKVYLVILIISATISLGFAGVNKYFLITQADVAFKVPKSFPKPYYCFKNNTLSPEVFMLGRRLFYDPVLSKDSTISCSSCHQRLAAFGHMDHKLSHGINGLIGRRNVPPLQNLLWKKSMMWDGGVNHLEMQPVSPITNPVEMDETLEHVIAKLRANRSYVEEFETAFHDTAISSSHILKALAQFTGLMVSVDSRYDRYMNGTDTFSVTEKKGLALFREKCASCHAEPLFTDNSFRNNGLKPDTALNDQGRAVITGDEHDKYRFQVPSLRNIEMTFPYMHDGRYKRLKDVLDYYGSHTFNPTAEKEIYQIGTLSEEDKRSIYAFLLTLTDKTFLYDRRFMDPNSFAQ